MLYIILFLIILTVSYLLFRREKGWIRLLKKRVSISDKVLSEDLLKCMAECQMEGEQISIREAAGSTGISENEVARIFSLLMKQNYLELDGKKFSLTNEGLEYGLRMIRAHRLYELFMSEYSGYGENEWHKRAHKAEHDLTDEDIQELDKKLNYPIHDPHGDPIPTSGGLMKNYPGKVSLNNLDTGRAGMIIHLEDEPPEIYRQLTAAGLFPGQYITVLEKDRERITIKTRLRELSVTPLMAANIQLIPKEISDIPTVSGKTLADCPLGGKARIQEISAGISGSERRRLMDLGFLPGTVLEKEIVSAAGDPMGFRIRDTLIALRKSQAEKILVELQEMSNGQQ